MMAEFLELMTPSSQRFYAYSYGGDWFPLLRHFAESGQRAFGHIVNFETFVQDDGSKFPVRACQVRKVEA
jgi:hypothetical protein